MTKIKYLLNIVENFCYSIWGLTMLDIIPLINVDVFDSIDNTIKTLMALFGAIYFLIQLPFKITELFNKKKLQKIEIEIQEEVLEKQRRENDEAEKIEKTDKTKKDDTDN